MAVCNDRRTVHIIEPSYVETLPRQLEGSLPGAKVLWRVLSGYGRSTALSSTRAWATEISELNWNTAFSSLLQHTEDL